MNAPGVNAASRAYFRASAATIERSANGSRRFAKRERTQAEVARMPYGSAEDVHAVGAASGSSVYAEGGETA